MSSEMNKHVTMQSKDIDLNLDFHTCTKCCVWKELITFKYLSWRKKVTLSGRGDLMTALV